MLRIICHTERRQKDVRRFFIFWIFLLYFFTVNAGELMKREYAYRCFTTADGLPAMRNESLIQDNKGFIWIAGAYGLACYDGFEFTTYLKGKYANLMRLDLDRNGQIRSFTGDLMYKINEKNDSVVCTTITQQNFVFEQFNSRNLPDGYGIFSNNESKYLFAINDTGIVKILEHEILNNYMEYNTTFYDVEKNLLYLPLKDTVFVVSDKEIVNIYPGINANSLYYYKDSVIALASNGIYLLKNGNSDCIFSHIIDIYSNSTKIYTDDKGVIFFCADQHLLRIKDNCIDTLLTANLIKDFIIDSDENIWVLTSQGLYNLFRLDFINYVLTDKYDVVRNVLYQPDNDAIIAATLDGNVYKIKDADFSQIDYPANPYNAAFFYDYGCYADDAVYLPGPGDVLMLKGKEKRWLNLPFYEYHGFVANLPDGNLLTGGAYKLFVFTTKGKLLKEFGKTTVKQTVYAKPCTDKQGRLWLGGFNGVTIYDLETDSALVTLFTDSLKIVKYMHNDNEGNVWFASENRLFKSEENTALLEHTFEYVIQGIFFTRDNRLIVSTLGGIYIFDRDRNNYLFYNHENGFTGIEPSSGAMVEDASGNVWMPSLCGLVCFNPEQLILSQPKPKLQLLSMTTSVDNVHWKATETPELNYQQDNVRFSYIGLSYLSAQNVRYRYRLVGFQNDFSEPVKLREVTFNNLPPGDYIFEIYADTGIEGSRSETMSVSFAIHPAFWQTTLFWVICAALLMLLSACITLYFQRRKNKAILERLETEKRLNDLKISSIRLKAIPHFNANVMAAIEYYIMNKSKEDTMRILGIYSNFTFETLQDVDKASRSLSEELKYVKMYLELEKIRFVDKFDYALEVDENVEADNVQLPNMILHTWAENAVKHGLSSKTSGGRLIISANQTGNFVCVSVEDNGIGREAATNNPRVRSSKQGLNILSQQIEIYNKFNKQKIIQAVDDLFAEGKASGTKFSLKIPTSFNYKI